MAYSDDRRLLWDLWRRNESGEKKHQKCWRRDYRISKLPDLSLSDLCTTRPTAEVNDIIINSFIQVLKDEILNDEDKKVQILDTHFFDVLYERSVGTNPVINIHRAIK